VLPGGAGTTPGAITLQPQNVTRHELLETTLAALASEGRPARQAAAEALVTYTGGHNAGLIQRAVGQHGAPAVQDAAAAIGAMVAQYREEGQDDAEVLATFQRGQATQALRGVIDTPLRDPELAAVADMVLLPQRQVTRADLVATIGQQMATGQASDVSVAAALGAPVHFGGQTAAVRGVIAGAQALQLAPEDMVRLAERLRDGLWAEAQTDLARQGFAPADIHRFFADLAALPPVLRLPQSTARRPRDESQKSREEA
jgi:hypothetical protein